MYLIVGLGNPGSRYAQTRHNIGFTIVDRLAGQARWTDPPVDVRAAVATVRLAGREVVLVKPLTYMNDSGKVIPALMTAYAVQPAGMLAVLDDINLPLGSLRFRRGGRAGGHNGLESIIRHAGSSEFPRLRAGVGQNISGANLADYVLDVFAPTEQTAVEQMTVRAAAAVTDFVVAGIEPAMNRYNTSSIPDSK